MTAVSACLDKKDPTKESRKREDSRIQPFPPKGAKQIAPAVYQLRGMIYVGDKL